MKITALRLRPSPGSTPLLRPIGLLLLLSTFGWAAAVLDAQPLAGVVCANGGPNYPPNGMSEFLAGDIGTPMLKHTLSGAESQCNDGTQAVMYIRPADAVYTGNGLPPADREQEKWVIHFLGGGGCGDADQCLERWCGLTGIDQAGKMSTTGTYDAIAGLQGILRRDPAVNEFAGYNQVVLYYCDSSNWIGSESHTSITATAGPMAGTSYDIEFNGEAIVNDAFNTLLAGPTFADPVPAATFYNTPLPSLMTADEIVISGDSAGGGGARHHLDRLQDLLAAAIPGPPRIYGVIDAGAPPALWESWILWGGPGAPGDYADYLQNVVDPRAGVFWGAEPTAVDQSCLDPAFAAVHNLIGSHPEICYDTTFTLMNHITTPFFLRMDINDPLAKQKYVDWGLFGSVPDYWLGQVDLLLGAAAGAGGLEPWPLQPGVFGPKCNRHVSILNNQFFTHHVSPVGLSFHDLLVNWRDGLLPISQIQPDFNAGPFFTPSFCP